LRCPAQIRSAFCCVIVALLFVAGATCAARPQYGGVLRVELRASSITLNPRRWKPGSQEFATNERLAELIFDRLVWLDNYGRFQPQLATDWSHDSSAKRWQFTLRQGVKFSDGTLLAPGDVVAALQPLLATGMQISATPNGVTIQSPNPASDLLEQLASGSHFVYRSDEQGNLLGTGPFVLENATLNSTFSRAEKSAADGVATQAQHLRFRFNDLCWSGRPFVDAVDVTLGVPPQRALLDLQLGKADLAELSEDTARRAQQSSVKLWTSLPLTLYAVKFPAPPKSANDRKLREALSLSLDRNAMARVLLQKQAEAASSFLPQWLSGYAFLFDMESNLERAKELRASLTASSPGAAQPLHLMLDGNNDLSKLIAERVVVNARAAGLTLQIVSRTAAHASSDGTFAKAESEAQLVSWRYTSLSPREALDGFALSSRWEIPPGGVPADADARYAWEKHMMEEKNLLPLVSVPDFVALDSLVRNWSPSAWGDWHLADVWLDQGDPGTNLRDAGAKTQAGAKP
jgi:peptide/nickel transport system substrate-binding protein